MAPNEPQIGSSLVPCKRPHESSSSSQDSNSRSDNEMEDAPESPICPPRVSFGVEIEFVIAECSTEDPDLLISGSLPPINTDLDVYEKVAECLRRYDIDAHVPQHSEEQDVTKLHMWTVTYDESIRTYDERGSGYTWRSMELKSPASYACEEAFKMIKIVVSLITANFRCRVNSSCGIHVHVGNGPYRMDLQAARNFAVLTWAAEPKLSVLHCPSRTTCLFSESSRRVKACNLAVGKGAADAYREVVRHPKWMARYQGRARKIGEPPIASSQKLWSRVLGQEEANDGSFLEPECNSDDSDIEVESEAFSRPKKVPGHRVRTNQKVDLHSQGAIPSNETLQRLDDNKLRGGPPQINFPLPEAIRQLIRNRQTNETATAVATPMEPTLERPRKPIRERHGPKASQMTLEEIFQDSVVSSRYQSGLFSQGINDKRPVRVGTWSGAAELLSCDIGTHQVAYLMGGRPHIGSNWEGQEKDWLSVLPTMRHKAGNSYMTIESREAGGSLDGEWIATWARIQCRLLEFARDAEPSEFMRIIGLLSEDDGRKEVQYDVVDLLEDIGCYSEAQYCEERLERGEEALFDCMLLDHISSSVEDEESSSEPKVDSDETTGDLDE
ncbi:hypothetical protein G7Z17_g12095 [Cylindrodendrum hubeiense]|uniref:Uncharacterized protein n=1 Tax=Cylindrodendrum hubeiense TaxID=595255 RepID=A0A9P5GUQ2_9HYPO|nr:hypothetical protein G7Z17_g12095 [Cylindrodendrum hubeiense]